VRWMGIVSMHSLAGGLQICLFWGVHSFVVFLFYFVALVAGECLSFVCQGIACLNSKEEGSVGIT
jgi:hypothetical protein